MSFIYYTKKSKEKDIKKDLEGRERERDECEESREENGEQRKERGE